MPAMSEADPVVEARFRLTRTDRIATAGSCFAQHIARTIVSSDFNYFVSEKAPAGTSPDLAEARQFGLFSARFGNIYTTRQLVQLFERAYGRFRPKGDHWMGLDGGLIDPFRPTIEPSGFSSVEALHLDRETHFAAVRDMFENLDVFVFALGLTECWRAKSDGAVFPLAPGVAGGRMDAAAYEFHNLTFSEVSADLAEFWKGLREINPSARMILTVSPVPLIATYEQQSALVSTTYSKAVLRSAVEHITRTQPQVAHFPSYEVITGNHAGNACFEDDLRTVRAEGVAHVMSLFLRHYAGQDGPVSAKAPPQARETRAIPDDDKFLRLASIVCDEARLDPDAPLPHRGTSG